MLESKLKSAPLVPLIQADNPEVAIETVRALNAGGLDVIEVVLRTDRALECLDAIASNVPEALVGAGTVLSRDQAARSIDSGAKFIVSPGLDDETVRFCQDKDVDIYPGTITPGEVQRARNLDLRIVKFFPASLAGGPPMLKAFSSVFRDMQFMPTGGISAANLADYLALPAVLACGGSWLTPADAVREGRFEAVTTLAREALAIAQKARD